MVRYNELHGFHFTSRPIPFPSLMSHSAPHTPLYHLILPPSIPPVLRSLLTFILALPLHPLVSPLNPLLL